MTAVRAASLMGASVRVQQMIVIGGFGGFDDECGERRRYRDRGRCGSWHGQSIALVREGRREQRRDACFALRLEPTNKSWRVDETYIRVQSRWCYHYRDCGIRGDAHDPQGAGALG